MTKKEFDEKFKSAFSKISQEDITNAFYRALGEYTDENNKLQNLNTENMLLVSSQINTSMTVIILKTVLKELLEQILEVEE